MPPTRPFHLGASSRLEAPAALSPRHLPAHHLVTHGVVVGMTGSGKTGLVTVAIEEALRSGVPALVVDVKGDMPDLLLDFPSFSPEAFLPWVAEGAAPGETRSPDEIARDLAAARRDALLAWGITEPALAAYRAAADVRVITPGSTAGEPLHVLSSLERRSPRWDTDPESARLSLSAAVSLVLRLLGRDADPARSREHVLLSLLAERRLLAGGPADLGALLHDLAEPPLAEVGALPLEAFLPRSERKALAAALNTLLASPTFASWRQGATLDVGEWLSPRDGKTPAVIVSVAHLDDEERALVLGVLFEEVLSWVRSLPGSQRLRALVVFDEVYGFLPPHPQSPPTKRPLVALMKQARAFGVGVVIATQNPMDLDYRALSNAGLWAIGRLQTDADRERVVEGLWAADAQRAPAGPRAEGRGSRAGAVGERRNVYSSPARLPAGPSSRLQHQRLRHQAAPPVGVAFTKGTKTGGSRKRWFLATMKQYGASGRDQAIHERTKPPSQACSGLGALGEGDPDRGRRLVAAKPLVLLTARTLPACAGGLLGLDEAVPALADVQPRGPAGRCSEGSAAVARSGIRQQDHLQLAVRAPDCVVGGFRSMMCW